MALVRGGDAIVQNTFPGGSLLPVNPSSTPWAPDLIMSGDFFFETGVTYQNNMLVLWWLYFIAA